MPRTHAWLVRIPRSPMQRPLHNPSTAPASERGPAPSLASYRRPCLSPVSGQPGPIRAAWAIPKRVPARRRGRETESYNTLPLRGREESFPSSRRRKPLQQLLRMNHLWSPPKPNRGTRPTALSVGRNALGRVPANPQAPRQVLPRTAPARSATACFDTRPRSSSPAGLAP